MSVRKMPDLESLARERGYGVGRRGRTVLWWRNRDKSRVYSSSGVSDAWEDIVLDSSSEKQARCGTTGTKEKKT